MLNTLTRVVLAIESSRIGAINIGSEAFCSSDIYFTMAEQSLHLA